MIATQPTQVRLSQGPLTIAVIVRMFLEAIVAIGTLAAAAAVKLTSPGPALFRQRRYGLDGREITVYKFRSMSVSEDGASRESSR